MTAAIRGVLDEARREIGAGAQAPDHAAVVDRVGRHLLAAATPSLRPVINATGVVIHTNLGRAPLSSRAIEAVRQIADQYGNLEYDLVAGLRGSRHDHARSLLCTLTGAEDALVVNNNAGAVYLVLAALCQGRQVMISRSQLVEIGGGFRIPDVLRQSGALLVEVGTTNRTHRRDFLAAIGPETAALMRVHSSNFRQIGFVTMLSLAEMVSVARDYDLLLIDDLGSGTLLDTRTYGLAYEPTVQESIQAGADIVTFSGDKLLGGPQAGIVLGRRELIEQLRRHPMARALRVDKMTLAALQATLESYRRGRAESEIPVWQMIAAPADRVEARAYRWQAQLADYGDALQVWAGESTIGGGSLPGETLPTSLLAITIPDPDGAAAYLRQLDQPIICRIQKDALLFDPRTVLV